MKNNIFKIGFAVLVVLCGWLLYLNFFAKPEDQVSTKQNNGVIDEAKIEAKVIAQSVDKQGFSKTVTIRKAAILSNGDISKLPISKAVLDSLRLDNLDKDSKLQQASVIIGKLEAKLRGTKVTDSTNRTSYLYKDAFTTARFTPDSIGGTFDIDWKLKLVRHDYRKRKNFLSSYTYYTDILSPDPRITISGMQNLTIESHKPTRWGIGLQGGYYYDPSQRKLMPAIGVGLSYNLIRF